MSSANGKPHSEDHKSRSHRSRSREDKDRRRDRRDADDRKSRDGGHRERDRRSRSPRPHREHRRDDRDRHRERDSDKDDRRERRRKRDEGEEEKDDRVKRRKDDDGPATEEGSVTKSDRRDRSRDSERRSSNTDRTPRHRDDDYHRSRRDSEHRRDDRPRDERRDFERRDFERRGPPPRLEDTQNNFKRSPPRRRPSPTYEDPMEAEGNDDSEARSVFVSQLAARLTARDLGYFFEDKLGEGAVRDARIVTDRLSRRSKGIGYVELRTMELVDKAINLSGTVVMGLPIMVQPTESERNKIHSDNLNLPPGVHAPAGGAMQLYVGSLHFNLTESDIKQVFEPFGELEFVDLHKDPLTGRSKGYCFVQYKKPEDAKMALSQMDGFELAGRTLQLRVNTVHEKSTTTGRIAGPQDSLDESGGGNLNAASRQALMQKLARTESATPRLPVVNKPNIPQAITSRSVLLKDMFDPSEETERDWDKDLADDVRGECETKYGRVEALKVEKDSEGEIYVKFDSIESATKAIAGLNGRWFGGKQISAAFISDAMMQAHQ